MGKRASRTFPDEVKKASNWIMNEHLRLLHEFNVKVEKSPVLPQELAALFNAVEGVFLKIVEKIIQGNAILQLTNEMIKKF